VKIWEKERKVRKDSMERKCGKMGEMVRNVRKIKELRREENGMIGKLENKQK
jgi:hypothetical protein